MHHIRSSTLRVMLVLISGIIFSGFSGIAHAQQVGRAFPNFDAKDPISGKQFSLEDFRGKVVVIDFWATWCGPCVKELPNVKNAWRKHKDEGLVIISISLDSKEDKFRSFVRAQKMDWVHVMDGGGWETRLAKKYGIRSIPRMYVLDHNGVVLSDSARGPALDKAIRQALSKLPDAAGDAGASPEDPPKAARGPRTRDTLRADLNAANLALDATSMPFEALARRLDSAHDSASIIKSQMPAMSQPELIRRSYERMMEDLRLVRHELFVCGCLDETSLAMPRNPFDSEAAIGDERQVMFAVAGEIDTAIETIGRMTEALGKVRSRVAEHRQTLDRLARKLERDDAVADEISAARTEAERLRDDCRDAWRGQLEAADRQLESLLGVEAGTRDELDALILQVDACRTQLQNAARSSGAQVELRESLTTLISRTRTLADECRKRGVIEIESDQLPTNPLERGLARDVRTRLEVDRELTKASELLRRMEAASYDPNETLRTFGDEVEALQKMLADSGGRVPVLLEVQKQFRELCTKLLAEIDSRNAS